MMQKNRAWVSPAVPAATPLRLREASLAADAPLPAMPLDLQAAVRNRIHWERTDRHYSPLVRLSLLFGAPAAVWVAIAGLYFLA